MYLKCGGGFGSVTFTVIFTLKKVKCMALFGKVHKLFMRSSAIYNFCLN